MPRNAWLWAPILVGACSFDAVYSGGHYTCSDGKCPAGYTCSPDKKCVTPGAIDAAIDTVDAREAALTCSDPGTFGATGGSATGDTSSRTNTVSASCGGFVMNAKDAVYKFDATLGQNVMISIAASYAANAYVITPCTVAPGTPSCVSNAYASPGNPLSFATPATTTYYLVVDDGTASLSGAYTVTLAFP
jgi:hypothetical protein